MVRSQELPSYITQLSYNQNELGDIIWPMGFGFQIREMGKQDLKTPSSLALVHYSFTFFPNQIGSGF